MQVAGVRQKIDAKAKEVVQEPTVACQ